MFRDKGLNFMEIKAVYELLKKRRPSNGTIGDLLERMERKGTVVKKHGRYYAGIKDEKLVLEVLDVKRVRAGRKGARRLVESLTGNSPMEKSIRKEESIPLVVKRILQVSKKLVERGETGKALGLIQHTLIGTRKTGRWILWVKDIFIYKEEKAKPPYHYFKSKKIARILKNLGVKEGFIHAKPVDNLLHSLFPQGYREARRIHYLLKRLGWIAYGPPLVLYIAVYPSNIGGVKLENLDGETIVVINYNPRKAVKIIKSMVTPGEHVDEYNDNTYFRFRYG